MANETETLRDAGGRTLIVRDLSALEDMRLLRAIGPYQSDNRPYVELVQMAASVRFIDGKPQVPLTGERQIDASVEALGDNGLAILQARRVLKLKALYAAAEAAAAQAQADAAVALAEGKEVAVPGPLTESASS